MGAVAGAHLVQVSGLVGVANLDEISLGGFELANGGRVVVAERRARLGSAALVLVPLGFLDLTLGGLDQLILCS